MPAVELSKLRLQINELIGKFNHPEEFQNSLNQLFEIYGDRVYKHGKVLQPVKLIPSYHTPSIILQQLEREFVTTIQQNPDKALIIAERLWREKFIEPRLFAIAVLAQIPLSDPDPVIKKFYAWCQPDEDNKILTQVLTKSSAQLRRVMPEKWLELIKDWLSNPDVRVQIIGLKAMLSMINEREFENLPVIFPILSELIKNAPSVLHAEIAGVMKVLYGRTPRETVHFLQQEIQPGISQDGLRLIRRIVQFFSPESREIIRKTLVNFRES